MAKERLVWFPFYPRDWMADTKVRLMTLEARGVYIDLLCFCWMDGHVTADADTLRRTLRLSRKAFARIWPQLEPCLTRTATGWVQKRVEGERAKQRIRRGKKRPAQPEYGPYEASQAFLASAEWRRLRMRVLVTRGAICECCGASSAAHGVQIHVDHIQPRRKRPDLALDETNLQVLCEDCNHGKGNWDQTDWRTTYAESAPVFVQPWQDKRES